MKKALLKDSIKEIVKTFKRFISILLIVLLGVGFFAGIKAASPDMKITLDKYFDDKNVMDFQVISTLGITNEDIEEIKRTNLDQYLRKRGCTGLQDVGDGKYVSRATAVMESTKSAIASNRFIERCKMIDKHMEEYGDTDIIR